MFLLDLASGRQKPLLSLVPELMLNEFSLPRDQGWIYFLTLDNDADLWLAELE